MRNISIIEYCRYASKITGRLTTFVLILLSLIAITASNLLAASYQVLYSFSGTDGANPASALIQDTNSNLYGTTYNGGPNYSPTGFSGNGTVYKITPLGVFTNLYSFTNSFNGTNTDGTNPYSQLILGNDGLLYGTAHFGGAFNNGTVYKLNTNGTGFTNIHDFDGTNGGYPYGGLLQDVDGTLYGTTSGNPTITGFTTSYGSVFKLSTTGSGYTNQAFANTDGGVPIGNLIKGLDGNIYGTTYIGGSDRSGVVFSVNPSTFTRSVFYNITAGPSLSFGTDPLSGLFQASDGNFYGTNEQGGLDNGSVFKLSSTGTLVWDTAFTGTEGALPNSSLIMASDGNLYGTSRSGGTFGNGGIYKLTPNGVLSGIYSFFGTTDGGNPIGGLLLGNDGFLYGTAYNGGANGLGAIFRLILNPNETAISPDHVTAGHNTFTITIDGSNFTNITKVLWGLTPLTTTFVSQTRLTATVPSALVAAAGTANVSAGIVDVIQSNAMTFTINSVPAISSLSPNTITAGAADFSLTVNGSNFVSDDVVQWNGAPLSTTYVSATQLVALVPAALVASAGTANVSVVTYDGFASSTLPFTITPAPVITGLKPSSARAGSAGLTMQVIGTGFKSTDTVMWSGQALNTTFVSATELDASVTSALLATAGNNPVTVTTADGVTSNSTLFTVYNAPTLTSLSPSHRTAGTVGFTLTVNGSNFVPQEVVQWNGSARTTSYVSSTQLTAQITAADIAAAGSANVTVVPPDGIASSPLVFTIDPAPVAISLSPSQVTAGHASFTLTVTGRSFLSGDIVQWNGNALTTTFVSATSLTATVPAVNVATVGTANITVITTDSVTSNALTLSILAAPTITSLSPTSITAGHAAFTLTVNGTNFVTGDSIQWNGASLTTTVVSTTQLTASVPAANVSSAGTANIRVASFDGITTSTLPFTILNARSVTSLSPSSVTAGHPAFTLTVNGTNFLNGDTVQWNGTAVTTTFVSATQLTASIPAANVATAGTANVRVITSDGVATSTLPFTILNARTVTSLSPSTITAGHPTFTLTVNGTNFLNGDTVQWNGTAVTTTFVSATQLTATVPAANVATAGTANVGVITSDGVTTSTLRFTILNARTVTSLSPSSVTAGHAAFTLTVNGTNFLNGDTVQWNGTSLTTTFVSATQLTASVPAANVASAGTANVRVITTDGVATSSLPFTIFNARTITSLAPTSVTAGHPTFTLTVNGTNFLNGDTVQWNGQSLITTFVSGSQLTATVLAANVSTAGSANIRVITPDGVVTGTLPFTILSARALRSLSPSSTTAGHAAFTLTVNGINFVNGDTVRWNAAALTTTYVSATQLTVTVPAANVASAGTANVSVITSDGVATGSLPFTINPAPVISSLSPNSVTVGSAAFTLTINGANFVSGDIVKWNGGSITTTSVSATQLSVTIPASSVSHSGTASVTITDPLGITSNAATFTINALHTYPAGISMVSAPYDYTGLPFSTILNASASFAYWNPVSLQYIMSPSNPADTFHQGQGLWANFSQATSITMLGTDLTAATGSMTVSLSRGWNMIGDPFTVDLPLSSIQVIDSNNKTYTLADANKKGLVYPVFFTYNGTGNNYNTISGTGSLQSYKGYWIDAFASCTLKLTSPNGNSPHNPPAVKRKGTSYGLW